MVVTWFVTYEARWSEGRERARAFPWTPRLRLRLAAAELRPCAWLAASGTRRLPSPITPRLSPSKGQRHCSQRLFQHCCLCIESYLARSQLNLQLLLTLILVGSIKRVDAELNRCTLNEEDILPTIPFRGPRSFGIMIRGAGLCCAVIWTLGVLFLVLNTVHMISNNLLKTNHLGAIESTIAHCSKWSELS